MIAEVKREDAPRRLEPYGDGLELLTDLLARLDDRLRVSIDRLEGNPDSVGDANLPGLVVTGAQVRHHLDAVAGYSLLEERRGFDRHPDPASPKEAAWSERPALGLWESVAKRVESTREAGLALPLDLARERFRLVPFELDCLVACLAPEVDSRYEKVFAYLNDDLTRKFPSVGLLLFLLAPGGGPAIRFRHFLAPQARLFKSGLLTWVDGREAPASAHLARGLRLETGMVSFFLGEPYLDPLVAEVWDHPASPAQAVDLWRLAEGDGSANAGRRLTALLERYADSEGQKAEPLVCSVVGRPGSGRRFGVETACAGRGFGVVAVDARRLLAHDEPGTVLRRLFRDSVLEASPVLLTHADVLAEDPVRGPLLVSALEREMNEKGWLIFLCAERRDQLRGWFPQHARAEVTLPSGSYDRRAAYWRRLFDGKLEPAAADRLAETLAVKFRLTPGQIAQAFQLALGMTTTEEQAPDWWSVLHRSAALASAPRLGELAEKLASPFRLPDIVLPAAKLELLRDVMRHVHHRRQVMEEWRFDRLLTRGRGLNVLFSGPSGTGKTMAAEILGNELGMDLYRIDLASVVSKYIGETEKNLARIFREAEHADVILFFDEADALFGKRSAVRDAHDRYANIEINYLLQQMETYEGIAILASNLRQNLDQAFLRRIRIVLEFPLPSPEDRLRIWRRAFPETVPLGPDVDFLFLARAFDLSGGSITNIGLAAAFLAADEGGAVAMRHLVRATRQELEKLGKRALEDQFGSYFDLLEPPAAVAAES